MKKDMILINTDTLYIKQSMLNNISNIDIPNSDLILAIYNDTGATLGESITITRLACKKCYSELLELYGLNSNYTPSISSCKFCKN